MLMCLYIYNFTKYLSYIFEQIIKNRPNYRIIGPSLNVKGNNLYDDEKTLKKKNYYIVEGYNQF